jgi:hypothetical protein
MQKKVSSRMHHYIAGASIFWILVALVTGAIGCASTPQPGAPIPYALNISSTTGGFVTVTIDGTETVIGPEETQIISTIPAGTEVILAASPYEGYKFVEWAGGTVNGATNALAIINMQDNYEIITDFEAIPATYRLTMLVSPVGSGTATDMMNAGPYLAGALVNIKATSSQGYYFVNWTAQVGVFHNPNEAETTFTVPGEDVSVTANFAVDSMIAAGGYDTVGLRFDGTVVGVGLSTSGQCDIGGWENTVQVAAGGYHTVGLTTNGTVLAVGDNAYSQCDVGDWTDIIQVAAGYGHTVGLKSDGTVVATGNNNDGQCSVSSWTDIIQVAAGYNCTVGLKSDGAVVAAGDNSYGQCNVGDWTDIIQVTVGGSHTVGAKFDGTVVAVGRDNSQQCDVGNWTDMVEVAAGYSYTVGLKSDGTVVSVGDNSYGQCSVGDWTDIGQLAAGYYHTVGLRTDQTLVAVGLNTDGQCDVNTWNLN